MAAPPTTKSHLDTANDHGPLLFSTGWCMIALAILSTGTRLATRWALGRRFQRDDYLVVASTVFGLAQTIAVTVAIANGDGRHQNTRSKAQLDALQKSLYAGDIFYVLSLALARISLGELILLLSPIRRYNKIIFGNNISTALWAFAGIFAFSFQCHLPDPWRYIGNKCINLTALNIYIDAMTIVTDAILLITSMFILIPVQIRKDTKLIILGCFSCRVFVIGATITHIYYTAQTESDKDTTFQRWPQTVAAQVTQSLNIVTACIPYLRPFYESLQSGMLGTDDLRRRKVSDPGSYMHSSWSGGSKSKNTIRFDRSGKDAEAYGHTAVALSTLSPNSKRNMETESQSSQAHIIAKTQTYSIQSEKRQGASPTNGDDIDFAGRNDQGIV